MCRTYEMHEVGDYGVIYCLTSPSGKKYIGQTWNIVRRWNKYKNININKMIKLYNALKKYGPENFKYEIIDLCETQTEMDSKERFYIMDVYDSMNNGYNCNEGGKGNKGFKMSIETRKRMSEKRTGKNNPFFGKCHTMENRLKSSERNKLFNTGSNNPFFGKCHTITAKEKISKSKLGKNIKQHVRDILKKYVKCGADNYFAKKFTIYSPSGELFFIVGELKKFTKKHNLSLTTVKKYINKGKIPSPKNKNHNRMTTERINTTGWEFINIYNS